MPAAKTPLRIGFAIILCASNLVAFAARPLPPSVKVQAASGGKFRITFTYKDAKAKSANLAGTFNQWSGTETPMTKSGEAFSGTIELPDGTYLYKFVVDGRDWKPDPDNPVTTDDNYGGRNSVVDITADSVAAAGSTSASLSSPSLPPGAQSPFPSVVVVPLDKRQNDVTFRYSGPGDAVAVAGSFNGWSAMQNRMEKKDGVFTAKLRLADDLYYYKFVVDGAWKQDPSNPEGAEDGHGGENSVLRLGPGANIRSSAEKTGDGRVNPDGLYHDPATIEYFNPQADGSAIIKVRALAKDATTAEMRSGNPVSSWGANMASEWSDQRFEFFRAHVKLADLGGGFNKEASYRFRVSDGTAESAVTLDADGPQTTGTGKPFARKVSRDEIFSTPEWARHVVWYDLFPERFRNGDKSNDPKTPHYRKWTSDWEKPGPGETPDLYKGVFERRYGGDMQGVRQQLPYLKKLGIGAIWFNPVFKAESLHKYDATDYRHIDDNFGVAGDFDKVVDKEDLLDPKTWTFTPTDKIFLELVKECHAAGIKVVLDGVFNHTGKQHPAFRDLVKNGKNSRFKNWYHVTDWNKPWELENTPFTYEGWFGFGGLPVFHEDSGGFVDPTLRRHIFDVTRRWMDPNGDGDPSDGIDGWRLDVAGEVSSEFWKEWRKVVKGTNPEAIIMAEEWEPPQRYLRGDQFDCVMNYANFSKPMIRFWADGGKPSVFASEIATYRHTIPDQSQLVMMNLMNSHDTDRLASMLFNPGRIYDKQNRVQELKPEDPKYKTSKPPREVYEKLKGLLPVQFSYVGGPMIYYGDEAGMWGADDPGCRKPMIWKDLEPYEKPSENFFMKDVFEAYQRNAAVRNTYHSLHTGEYETLLVDDESGIIAFRRFLGAENAVTVANNSGQPRNVEVPLSAAQGRGTYVDVIRDPAVRVVEAKGKRDVTKVTISASAKRIPVEGGKLRVSLPPFTSTILVHP